MCIGREGGRGRERGREREGEREGEGEGGKKGAGAWSDSQHTGVCQVEKFKLMIAVSVWKLAPMKNDLIPKTASDTVHVETGHTHTHTHTHRERVRLTCP